MRVDRAQRFGVVDDAVSFWECDLGDPKAIREAAKRHHLPLPPIDEHPGHLGTNEQSDLFLAGHFGPANIHGGHQFSRYVGAAAASPDHQAPSVLAAFEHGHEARLHQLFSVAQGAKDA